MDRYALDDLADRTILTNLDALDARDRDTTAELLANLAQVDERKLYVPAGYPCMRDYCMYGRGYSKDVANKRIRAARAARDFPAIFEMLADGRLHLCGVSVLACRLTPENADELLAAACHKTREEIERLLAERFPQPDLPEVLGPCSPAGRPTEPVAPGPPDSLGAPGHLDSLVAPGPLDSPAPHATMKPLAADRSSFQCTIPRRVEDKIRWAQTLASHQLPSGDLATLLELFVDAYIEKQEKKKFAATKRPRSGSGHSSSPRRIPAAVKRAVVERDQWRCTFVSEAGRRCTGIKFLEFDHVEPVARGGQSTVENLRLLCRAHNQLAAECTFGAGFMSDKRAEARARATARQSGHAPERIEAKAPEPANDRDVVPYLMHLGCRATDARRAAALCDETMPEGSLAERLRFALQRLAPPHRREPAMAT